MKTQPKIIDTTLKEGSVRTNHLVLAEQVENIARESADAGIQYLEACHFKGIGAKTVGYPAILDDEEFIAAAKKSAPQLKIVVFISSFPFSEDALPKLLDHFDVGRVGVNVHEAGLATKIIQQLKKANKTVIGHLFRIHGNTPTETAQAAKVLQDSGADILYLADTFGSLRPDELKSYLNAVRQQTNLPLGFQGRNNLGLAMQNSLTALREGVEYFDASIMGMGQGCGVTSLETLVALFQSQGLLPELALQNLCTNGKFYVLPAFKSLPYSREIDLRLAKARLDYTPQQLFEIITDFLDHPLPELLEQLKKVRPDLVQLKEHDFREYLKGEKIDFDILLQYLQTGGIPVFEEN